MPRSPPEGAPTEDHLGTAFALALPWDLPHQPYKPYKNRYLSKYILVSGILTQPKEIYIYMYVCMYVCICKYMRRHHNLSSLLYGWKPYLNTMVFQGILGYQRVPEGIKNPGTKVRCSRRFCSGVSPNRKQNTAAKKEQYFMMFLMKLKLFLPNHIPPQSHGHGLD